MIWLLLLNKWRTNTVAAEQNDCCWTMANNEQLANKYSSGWIERVAAEQWRTSGGWTKSGWIEQLLLNKWRLNWTTAAEQQTIGEEMAVELNNFCWTMANKLNNSCWTKHSEQIAAELNEQRQRMANECSGRIDQQYYLINKSLVGKGLMVHKGTIDDVSGTYRRIDATHRQWLMEGAGGKR
jgi:hypothetical protein